MQGNIALVTGEASVGVGLGAGCLARPTQCRWVGIAQYAVLPNFIKPSIEQHAVLRPNVGKL